MKLILSLDWLTDTFTVANVRSIIKNPKPLLDALVEAGLLADYGVHGDGWREYRLAPTEPHVHETLGCLWCDPSNGPLR
jgi:hypothetical protein